MQVVTVSSPRLWPSQHTPALCLGLVSPDSCILSLPSLNLTHTYTDKSCSWGNTEVQDQILSFSLWLPEVREQVLPTTVFSYPTTASGQAQSIQGTSLNCLALVAWGTDILELQILQQLEIQYLGGHHPTRHYTDSKLKHTPVYLWKRPIYLAWSLTKRGMIQVSHTSRS